MARCQAEAPYLLEGNERFWCDPYRKSISLSTAAASKIARRSAPSGVRYRFRRASVVAELDAVVGVALEAADDDDAISLAVLGTLVC
jgi:hypothetical protein